VSLLFYAKELKYYVALYLDGTPWRALKANDLDTAQGIFHQFELQAMRLADGQTPRVQLEAQNEQLTKMIVQAEAQADQLRKALQRSTTQEQAVTSRQHQIRREVAQLEAQRVAAQAQLNKVHRQIHQLDLAAHDGVPHLTNG
jgi:chromosome segregation ATPase